MKLKYRACIILIILIFVGVVGLSFTNDKSMIIGSWEVSEKSIYENLDNYPVNGFVIYENGTVTADGYGGTYSINDNTITITISYYSFTYEYKLSGNTLMLKLVSDYDKPEIYYKKIF